MSFGLNAGTDYGPHPKKVLIAYHADCLDGFTSAWVACRALEKEGEECTLLAMEYTTASDIDLGSKLEITDYEHLYVVDFSLKVEVLENIESNYSVDVTILDHHKTAFESYAPEMKVDKDSHIDIVLHGATIILENFHSGAGLCHRFFNPGLPSNKLVDFVEDYDLWRFSYEEHTKWINKLLMTQPKTLSSWDYLDKVFSDPISFDAILANGKALQIDHDIEVDIIAREARGITIKGEHGLVVPCQRDYISDVGHALAIKSGTYGAMYQLDLEKGKIIWSFRSDKEGDFDVSALAKKLGGGGHKNAAGATLDLWSEDLELPEIEGAV